MPGFEAKPIEWVPAETHGKYENSNIWKWGYVDAGKFGRQLVRINQNTERPYASDLRRFSLIDKQDPGRASAAKHDAALSGKRTTDDKTSASGDATSASGGRRDRQRRYYLPTKMSLTIARTVSDGQQTTASLLHTLRRQSSLRGAGPGLGGGGAGYCSLAA